ncbi:MAG: polysaccharide pyruvyl transferase CsaB [Clostridia bacterium]|nr:polysaccharide pyruvyl transferase CsaB [Clostridia bacterium]
MRIMHFAGGGDIGGAKTHIISLGQELAREHAFRLVSFRRGPFAEEAREAGLQVDDVENAWNLPACLRVALRAVDEFRPELIHCHGAKANIMGVIVSRLRHIPVCTTVHSDPTRDYMGAPFKQALFGSINSWALKRMNYYMAVAGGMEQSLIRRGVNPQQIFVVYNGLDFSEATDQYRDKPPDEPIVVGIAARLTPIKNIPLLLRAFAKAAARNPLLRLRIAGSGEDEQELRRLAGSLGIDDCAAFVGWVSDMPGFFRGVDINVLTSLSETFPYSLLEGAYEHCAAVASSVGGIPELIRHGDTGFLFQPHEEDKLADYIYRLSVDSKLRRTLAENLFRRAREEFSLAKMRQVQEKAYALMLERSSRLGRRGAVICGAYGRGNAGDEAILQAIVGQLRQIDAAMPLTVLSRNKLDTRLKNKTNAIYIFNIPAFIRELRRARIFINGGGSLIQDVTSSRSLYFYLFTLWAARLAGCRVIMYGCGIGPVRHKINQKLAAAVLNKNVEIITVRDSNSILVLEKIGAQRPLIRLSADPTVTIGEAPAEAIADALEREGVPRDLPLIGFCLRNWPGLRHPEYLAQAAEYAWQRYGLHAVFLPIELPRDLDAAAKVTALLACPYSACRNRHEVEELIGILGSMKLVVGMRLHSLIFATLGGAPVIGVSYDIKVDSFIYDIGSKACIPLQELSPENLCHEIDLAAKNNFRQDAAAREALRRGERINIDSVRELLGEEVS